MSSDETRVESAGHSAEGTAGTRKRGLAQIRSEWCTGCRICVQTCPTHCIAIVESELNFNGIAVVDMHRCTGCNICAIDCPWTGVDMFNPDGSKREQSQYEKQSRRLRGYQ
jgi:2-oxoglutarate ferredoxin oxidoreductase subunit delta